MRQPNEIGNTYGRLRVQGFQTRERNRVYWECLCECGNVTFRLGHELRAGKKIGAIQSCGCFNKERIARVAKERQINGETQSREGSIHAKMIRRCYIETDEKYPYYGARGIKVCDRWLEKDKGLLNFIEDMGRVPDGMWLERIDVEKGYSPENCVWESVSNQQFNRRQFSNNTTGVTGVVQNSSGFSANIQHLGRRISKQFKSFEDAVAWRKQKEIELFGKSKPEHQYKESE